MQEMRISQLVLDPTSHADSKNLTSCCGETQSSFFICLATPVAEKKLVASRRSTRRQEAQGNDGDTNVHNRVAERS